MLMIGYAPPPFIAQACDAGKYAFPVSWRAGCEVKAAVVQSLHEVDDGAKAALQ
jgi:hypothetical protein